MIMKKVAPLILLLTVLFVIANIACEVLRIPRDNPLVEPMSTYLAGPYGIFQSASYIGLAIAVALVGYYICIRHWTRKSFYVGAMGLILVVITKYMCLHSSGDIHMALELSHVLSALTAFFGINIGLIGASYGTLAFALSIIGPTISLALEAFHSTVNSLLNGIFHITINGSPIEEKLYTIFLILTFFIMVYSKMKQHAPTKIQNG
jgi:hypothetical protein